MCQDARPRWAQAWGRRNRIPHLDGVRRGLLPSTSEGCQVGVGRCPAVLARSGERAGVMDTEATRRPGTRQRCQQALGRSHLGAESTPRIIDTPGSAPLTPLVPANMPRGQQFVWPLIWTVVSISSCQVAKRGTTHISSHIFRPKRAISYWAIVQCTQEFARWYHVCTSVFTT